MRAMRSPGPAIRVLAADPDHGPLPLLLLVLTVATGVVDAVSILRLGRVFVANMTGNVAFVGFALAGAPGFHLTASLAALAGFLVGAWAGGVVADRSGGHRGRMMRDGAAIELALLAAALIGAAAAGDPMGEAVRDTIDALAAIAMGLQNAVVLRLKVPDLTTTVLTRTLTGIAADLGGHPGVALRRVLAVLTMLGGAAIGAVVVLHAGTAAALGLTVGLVAVVAAGAVIVTRRPHSWHRPDGPR